MDYMYERLHVPYPLTIEVNSHRVLSCTHAHVGSASVCKNDTPIHVLSSIVHEQQSCRKACSDSEHRSCYVADRCHYLQPSVSNLPLIEAMQDMSVDLQTCDVEHHTRPVMIVIADVSSMVSSIC